MTYPLNHSSEYAKLITQQAYDERQSLARSLGMTAMKIEDEHHELMTLLSGGSVRRLAERHPCLALAALHKALGWK